MKWAASIEKNRLQPATIRRAGADTDQKGCGDNRCLMPPVFLRPFAPSTPIVRCLLAAGLLGTLWPLAAQAQTAASAASALSATAAANQAIPPMPTTDPITAAPHAVSGAAASATADTPTATAEPSDETIDATDDPADASAPTAQSFTIQIQAPSEIRSLVDRFLNLKRYQQVPDLDNAELQRLLELSDTQIRNLLATQGYFTPQIDQTLHATPAQAGGIPRVAITIDPGPRTHISSAEVEITGAVTPERLAALRERWLLPVGRPFRQEDWNNAKNQLLSDLLAEEHAAARLLDSLADIDPDTQRAALQVSYDAGPRYRYGELEIDGLYRFRPELVARYNADVRPGKVYRAEEVQALVHALQSSPYFATVRGELDLAQAVSDGEADSLRAPVRLTVQEQPVHRARFGVGASSNTGARVEASYSTIDFLRQAWALDTGVRLEEKRQTFYSDVFLLPQDDGVRYGAGFVAEQSDIEQLRIQRQSVGVQRIEQRGRLEERLSLNWQHEKR